MPDLTKLERFQAAVEMMTDDELDTLLASLVTRPPTDGRIEGGHLTVPVAPKDARPCVDCGTTEGKMRYVSPEGKRSFTYLLAVKAITEEERPLCIDCYRAAFHRKYPKEAIPV